MVEMSYSVFQRMAGRLGGPRVLALSLLRALAVLAVVTWLLLAPHEYHRWGPLTLAVVAFCLYCVAVEGSLVLWPAVMLTLNLWILVVDEIFVLLLIYLSGGAQSGLYLALPLLAALQSYYFGIARGTVVAGLSSVAYVLVVWPTLGEFESANVAIRLIVLVGTAIGVGVLAAIERRERRHVVALSTAARERERFIQSVVESLKEGVVALDADGRVVAWNEAMERRYGVATEEVLGKRFLDYFPGAAREPWSASLRQLLAGEIDDFTAAGVRHATLRRGDVIQNLKGSVLRDGARVTGAVLLIEDITERVALERSARQTEKLAALGTLAAGLAHELNNPIGIISSRAELMLLETEAPPLSDGLREDLQVIHRHAQRVTRIAQGLLSFARHSSHERGPVDLNRVVDETLVLVERLIVRGGVTLKRALAPDLPPIWGDANALQQVVMNLLTNARDATREGDEISVETAASDSREGAVRLIVRDTGLGIPPEILPNIFDPFFTTKVEGTGLGLSISYGIVREHRGTVDVQSQPGEGTTFVLTFRGADVEERV